MIGFYSCREISFVIVILFLFLKSNEVNQGDALEHNFTCLYKALEFPLVRLLTSDLHQVILMLTTFRMKGKHQRCGYFYRLESLLPQLGE